ncbi:MAG: hypothetical protein ACREPR_24630 [Brasilonema sp.]
MNKFAKVLLVVVVFAAPVALNAPAVQAKTATLSKTQTVAAKPVTSTKTAKVGQKKHYGKHHGKHKASHSGSTMKK